MDIRGTASPAAKVTVNGQNPQRLGDHFYKALTVDNSVAPQYPGVSVLAIRQAAGPNGEDVKSETLGNLFLAKTPEVFAHDAEGNLTADGRWTYTWDGENRLIRMETLAAVPAAAKRKLDFAYDAHSRRVRKQLSTWNGSAWILQSDRRYLYDGWNLVAELDATNTMLRTYTWGLDLSRTPQGAGGVGGLLALHEAGESYLPAYDGNGNVMALVKASDYTVAARYEYGPFGETLVAQESGISNPFRFSTKFQDAENGLYYYGYRYYDAVTGRWSSRDPIEESGGINLYAFVVNSPVGNIDFLGLQSLPFDPPPRPSVPDANDLDPLNGDWDNDGWDNEMDQDPLDPNHPEVQPDLGQDDPPHLPSPPSLPVPGSGAYNGDEIDQKYCRDGYVLNRRCRNKCAEEALKSRTDRDDQFMEQLAGCYALGHPAAIAICLASQTPEYMGDIRRINRDFEDCVKKCKCVCTLTGASQPE